MQPEVLAPCVYSWAAVWGWTAGASVCWAYIAQCKASRRSPASVSFYNLKAVFFYLRE